MAMWYVSAPRGEPGQERATLSTGGRRSKRHLTKSSTLASLASNGVGSPNHEVAAPELSALAYARSTSSAAAVLFWRALCFTFQSAARRRAAPAERECGITGEGQVAAWLGRGWRRI